MDTTVCGPELLLHSSPLQASCTRRSAKKTTRPWSPAEDERLCALVVMHDTRNWKKVATKFPERTSHQCLQRWYEVLRPELVKGPWTPTEDDALRCHVRANGTHQWREVTTSQALLGRSEKQCRERWRLVSAANVDAAKALRAGTPASAQDDDTDLLKNDDQFDELKSTGRVESVAAGDRHGVCVVVRAADSKEGSKGGQGGQSLPNVACQKTKVNLAADVSGCDKATTHGEERKRKTPPSDDGSSVEQKTVLEVLRRMILHRQAQASQHHGVANGKRQPSDSSSTARENLLLCAAVRKYFLQRGAVSAGQGVEAMFKNYLATQQRGTTTDAQTAIMKRKYFEAECSENDWAPTQMKASPEEPTKRRKVLPDTSEVRGPLDARTNKERQAATTRKHRGRMQGRPRTDMEHNTGEAVFPTAILQLADAQLADATHPDGRSCYGFMGAGSLYNAMSQ